MLSAWIVYGKADAEKNKSSIGMFKEELQKIGVGSKLVIFEYLKYESNGKSAEYEGIEAKLPDIVINRTRNYDFSCWLEQNIRFNFNCPKLVLLGNDKIEAYTFVKKLGFNTLDIFVSPEEITEFPVVAKTGSGHGGSEVFLVNDRTEAEELFKNYDGMFFQKYSPQGNHDMRVYIVGNRIYCAINRYSDKDFRSNFSLGGEVKEIEVPEENREEIEAIVKGIGEAAYCGIDFIKYKDKWIFSEIEDMVGARSVYTYTDYDPIGEFVKYIGKVIETERNND